MAAPLTREHGNVSGFDGPAQRMRVPRPGSEPYHYTDLVVCGGSTPCGCRHLAPGFNPGHEAPSIPTPLQGRRRGRGPNAADAVAPAVAGWCATPPLPTPLKGLENEIGPPVPRVETRGYVPAPTRGASLSPSAEMCVMVWVR